MLDSIDIKYFKLAIPGPYKESDTDVSAKCPVCGDSKHKRSSKRLHLFEKSDNKGIKCFNGGCLLEQIHSVSKFLKLYHPELYNEYKREAFGFKLKELKIQTPQTPHTPKLETADWLSGVSENFTVVKDSEIGAKEPEIPVTVNSSQIQLKRTTILNMNLLAQNLTSLNEETSAFLLTRGLNAQKLQSVFGKFYSGVGKFLDSGKYYDLTDTLFIPINFENKLTAFYARSIKEKRFVNANFYDAFIPWNLEKIDNTKPVHIFEAILDALSFYELYGETNIIALCTNNINPKVLEYIKFPMFCLDNDITGIKSMIKHTDKSKCSFLIYPSGLEYKDFNEMLLNNFRFGLRFESGFKANLELRKFL